jgi:hypothetical protein
MKSEKWLAIGILDSESQKILLQVGCLQWMFVFARFASEFRLTDVRAQSVFKKIKNFIFCSLQSIVCKASFCQESFLLQKTNLLFIFIFIFLFIKVPKRKNKNDALDAIHQSTPPEGGALYV